jgi:hypothetical protein
MHTKPIRALVDAAKDNILVRVGILAVVAAIIAWQFFPSWFKLSVVFSAGAPVLLGLAVGAAVGWLWLSWRLFAVTAVTVGGLAFVSLAVVSGLAECATSSLGYRLGSVYACERFIEVATGKIKLMEMGTLERLETKTREIMEKRK